MTLSQDELTEALHDGLKAAEACSNTFCRASAVIENEGYLIAHNGISSGDTDVQVVHATKTLGMNKEQLAERVKTWVAGLHTGVKLDLNAALSVSEMFGIAFAAAAARAWARAVAEAAESEKDFETRGPAVLGWPWSGA